MSVHMVTFLDPSVFDWQSICTSSRSYASCPLKALPYQGIFGEIESEIKYAIEQFLVYCMELT